ncbi:MAG: hypothetical protein BEN19_05680 [Epulopiscium sp. Nuni2H_MBin003]|nr:MAG: hypothetical protein BEN19_05680 [Epulopiscium sp. Nuni2H_MBin003]
MNDISIDELIERSKTNNIVIYGAGDVGKITFWALKNIGITPVLFIHDSPGIDKYNEVFIKPFMSVKEVENPLVIIAVSNNVDHMQEALHNIGVINIYIPLTLINEVKLTSDQQKKIRFEYKEVIKNYSEYYKNIGMVYIPILYLNITEGCSLKCKNCTALGDKYDKIRIPSLEEVTTNFELLLSNIDKIAVISFQHEPFLFKELDKFIDRYIDNPKIGSINLFTNGTIVPSINIIKKLNSPKINIIISDYRENSHNLKQLKKILEENNISFAVYTDENYGAWGEITIFENKISREQRCMPKCCNLIKDRFYYCPILAHGANTGIVPDCEQDYLRLDDPNFREKVNDFINDRKALPGCSYCGVGKVGKASKRGVQIK